MNYTHALSLALIRVSRRAAAHDARIELALRDEALTPQAEQRVMLGAPASTDASIVTADCGSGLDSAESCDEGECEAHGEFSGVDSEGFSS